MARCDTCGSTILFGGVRDGQRQYCNASCAAKGALVARSRQIPEDAVRAEVARLHRGPCPKCGGAGPVDVQTSYRVWSALYVTRWSSRPQVACRRCGTKARVGDAIFSLLFGWWGFPWGLVITPIQVVRNVAGLFRKSTAQSPSPQLAAMVRLHLATRQAAPRAGAA
jgi:hypothetical protein